MQGLEREIIIFLYAMTTGMIAKGSYDILYLLRKLIKHAEWVIDVEDIFYWISMSVYIFRSLFYTTYGSVRWFFALGLVCGVLEARFARKYLKKVLDKIKKTI